MFGTGVIIRGFSAQIGDEKDYDGIEIKGEVRSQRVISDSGATITESARLDKGLKVRDKIVVQNSTVKELTESTMGGIKASGSIFEDVKSRGKITMENCTAKDVTITMDGLKSNDSRFHDIHSREKVTLSNCTANAVHVSMEGCKIESSSLETLVVRDKAKLENSIVKENVKVSMSGLSWINKEGVTETIRCRSIEAREKIYLDHISAGSVRSTMDKINATNCHLGEVYARESVTLVNTPADTVEVTMGRLRVMAEEKLEVKYESLNASKSVTMSNIQAGHVKARDIIVAQNCVLGSIECNQSARIDESIVSKSIKLTVDPSKPCQLSLANTTVKGDIIVEVNEGIGTLPINATFNVGAGLVASTSSKVSFGRFTTADVSISGGHYNSISEIPANLKNMALMFTKEGNSVFIGNLMCTVKHGELVLNAEPKPVTLEDIKRQVARIIGSRGSCAHLEINGGVYNVNRGEIKIIKAPPGLVLDEDEKEKEEPKELPKVTVEISGGCIEGKVIFKNCQGDVKLVDGALCQNEIRN